MKQTNYAKETTTALFQGKPVTVTHLIPILTKEQKEKRKSEIENQLYDVFIKYSREKDKEKSLTG